jgi:hypothetical protein
MAMIMLRALVVVIVVLVVTPFVLFQCVVGAQHPHDMLQCRLDHDSLPEAVSITFIAVVMVAMVIIDSPSYISFITSRFPVNEKQSRHGLCVNVLSLVRCKRRIRHVTGSRSVVGWQQKNFPIVCIVQSLVANNLT